MQVVRCGWSVARSVKRPVRTCTLAAAVACVRPAVCVPPDRWRRMAHACWSAVVRVTLTARVMRTENQSRKTAILGELQQSSKGWECIALTVPVLQYGFLLSNKMR